MFGISKFRLAFEAQGGWAVFYALLALAVLLGVLYFYRRLRDRTERVRLVLLGTLRVFAVGLVVLLLFQPRVSFERRTTDRPVLLLALDNSRSMSIADVEHRPNRFQEARNFLVQGGAWDALADDFDVHVFVIGQSARATESSRALGDVLPDAEATVLGGSILDAAATLGDRRPERVLLFTDGQDNSGATPEDRLQELRAPVDCIGVGTPLQSENRFTDVALEDIQTRPTAAAEEVAEVTAYVEATGYEGERCDVSLWDKGLLGGAGEPKEVARECLVLDGKRGWQEVKLRFTPKELGLHRLLAKAAQLPGEKILENNEFEFLLAVTEPQIKVLYFDVVRGESRELKRAFSLDPHVRILTLIKVRQDFFSQFGDVSGLKLDRIPDKPETYGRFDVVIIGNLDATHFNAPAQAALKQFVENGKGLLWLAGEDAFGLGGYAESGLAPLIPVRMGGKQDGKVTEPFQMVLTPEGARHAVLRNCENFFLAPGTEVLPRESLKPLELLIRCLGPGPGASVLAEDPHAKMPDGHPLPVFVLGQYGRGRTAAFLAGPTAPWLTVQRGAGRETPYHRLWGQTLRFLASEETRFGEGSELLQAHMGRPFYRQGETAILYARALDSSGQLSSEATIEALIQTPAGKTISLTVSAMNDEVGSYQTKLTPEVPGTYRVTVSGRLGTRDLGKKELAFGVGRPNQEFEKLDLNEPGLRRISEKTNGRYVSLADAGNLIREMKSGERVRRKLYEFSLFNLPLFFLLFTGLVTLEWIIRKRLDLL